MATQYTKFRQNLQHLSSKKETRSRKVSKDLHILQLIIIFAPKILIFIHTNPLITMKKIFSLLMALTAILTTSCYNGQPQAKCDKPCCNPDTTVVAPPSGTVTQTADGQIVYTRDITTQSDHFVFDDSQEWERTGDPGEVYRKVMGYNDNMMMVKVKFKAGSEGKAHSHPHCQITYVESGVFEFFIGDETKVVRAGDVLMKLPNQLHGCKCLEDGMLVDTFTPMRATFIQQ